MPQYEYACPQCQNKFETMKAMGQRHRAKCPHCNTESKLVPSPVNHSFGFRLTERSHLRFGPRDEFEPDI